MIAKSLAQVLREEAWKRAKEEMLFMAATYKKTDPEHYAKTMKLMQMYIDIIEKRILPK